MKITASPISVKNLSVKSTPAFGFAKLNEKGREIADTFGYQNNSFFFNNTICNMEFPRMHQSICIYC